MNTRGSSAKDTAFSENEIKEVVKEKYNAGLELIETNQEEGLAKIKQALAMFKNIMAGDNDFRCYAQYVLNLIVSKIIYLKDWLDDIEPAINGLKKIKEKNSSDFETLIIVYSAIGYSLQKEKRHEAIQYYKLAIEIIETYLPYNDRSHRLLRVLYFNLGVICLNNSNEQIDYFAIALENGNRIEKPRTADMRALAATHMGLAEIYQNEKSFIKCKEQLRFVLRFFDRMNHYEEQDFSDISLCYQRFKVMAFSDSLDRKLFDFGQKAFSSSKKPDFESIFLLLHLAVSEINPSQKFFLHHDLLQFMHLIQKCGKLGHFLNANIKDYFSKPDKQIKFKERINEI
jgi:tetratricopeptide (TPR) repeat protein